MRRTPVDILREDGRSCVAYSAFDDLAVLAVAEGACREPTTIEALGPETYAYREQARMISERIGVRRPIVSVPLWLGFAAARMIGGLVGDVVITREEVEGLMCELLHVETPAAGSTWLSRWVSENRQALGIHYASELARRR